MPICETGTSFHQEVDLEKIYADVCDYQAVIRSPEEAPRVILRAIKEALSNRSVSRIELPADIAEMPCAGDDFIHPLIRRKKPERTGKCFFRSRTSRMMFSSGCGFIGVTSTHRFIYGRV